MAYKPFRYRLRPRPPRRPLNCIAGIEPTEEGLTGIVKGKEASAPEERFGRSFDRRGLRYRFRWLVQTPYQIPGQSYEIDYVVDEFGTHPIEIDDRWIHKGAAQKDKDKLRDAILSDTLQGWEPIHRIPVDESWDQKKVDDCVDKLFP